MTFELDEDTRNILKLFVICIILVKVFIERRWEYKEGNLSGFVESNGWEFYKHYLNAIELVKNLRYTDAFRELEAADTAYNNNNSKNIELNSFIKNKYADILALKGCVLQKMNRLQDAKAAYEKAIVNNINQPDVQRALNSLDITQ